MSDREKVFEQRRYAMAVSGGYCEVCGEPLSTLTGQMAHRIGNTELNRKIYGNFVVDHKFNVGMTCSLACNAKLDISKNPGKCIRLCERIYNYELSKYNATRG